MASVRDRLARQADRMRAETELAESVLRSRPRTVVAPLVRAAAAIEAEA